MIVLIQARARLIKDLPVGIFAGEKLQPKVTNIRKHKKVEKLNLFGK